MLVMTDYFTRWSDAPPIPEATALVVARTLDERVSCYMALPEKMYTEQGAQFGSSLMTELRWMWKGDKIRTTPTTPKPMGEWEDRTEC